MKIFKNINVFDEALNRIRFIFDEFENVVVSVSGGKDSTICFNLALIIAREKNRLPLNVMWIDQEAEWLGTVDHCEYIMTNPDVKPYWFQMPMVITNNASSYERYNYCWEEGKEWIRPKHDLSIKENKYGVIRFHDLFEVIFKVEFPNIKSCYISGVRAEENPKRFVSLTNAITYKYVTWGKVLNKKREHYTLYPLYDWSYTDVWKAIYDNKWNYNRIYDYLYKYGIPASKMRISNVHHETAIQDLKLIQEIEPETWEKIAKRIPGANTINQLKDKSFTCPAELPFMFSSWKEYCEHLIENLIIEEKNKILIRNKIKKLELVYTDDLINKMMYKTIINTILSNDWDLTKIQNWEMSIDINNYRAYKKGKFHRNNLISQYIPFAEKEKILHNFQ